MRILYSIYFRNSEVVIYEDKYLYKIFILMMKTIEEMNNVYIGFDFSMNKPAATIYYNKHFYFYFWALKLTDKKLQMYKDCNVHAISRNLSSIN